MSRYVALGSSMAAGPGIRPTAHGVPWTTKFGLPLPGRPAPLHPNAAGMRVVAELVVAQV
jgi:hypothetical protein